MISKWESWESTRETLVGQLDNHSHTHFFHSHTKYTKFSEFGSKTVAIPRLQPASRWTTQPLPRPSPSWPCSHSDCQQRFRWHLHQTCDRPCENARPCLTRQRAPQRLKQLALGDENERNLQKGCRPVKSCKFNIEQHICVSMCGGCP